jgi:hypothetical protein
MHRETRSLRGPQRGLLLRLVPLLALSLGCRGTGEFSARVSGQIVDENEAPLGPGLVLIESGHVHEGSYQLGAPIDAMGRFAVDLPSGGFWGLHIFADGYQYLPIEIEIEDHQQVIITSMMVAWGQWMDLSGQPAWPTQPTDNTLIGMPMDDITADNPTLADITMSYSGDLLEITAMAADPDGDLSKMILAYDRATGNGYALNAPSEPIDGDYPDGEYSLSLYMDPAHEPGKSKWDFVVSDNMCNDSPIITVTMPE